MNCRFRTVKQFQVIPLYFVLHSYWLDGPEIEYFGATISTFVQNGHGPHPAPCTVNTFLFTVIKRPECGIDRRSTSFAEIKKGVEL